jgi:hypothetical protein
MRERKSPSAGVTAAGESFDRRSAYTSNGAFEMRSMLTALAVVHTSLRPTTTRTNTSLVRSEEEKINFYSCRCIFCTSEKGIIIMRNVQRCHISA